MYTSHLFSTYLGDPPSGSTNKKQKDFRSSEDESWVDDMLRRIDPKLDWLLRAQARGRELYYDEVFVLWLEKCLLSIAKIDERGRCVSTTKVSDPSILRKSTKFKSSGMILSLGLKEVLVVMSLMALMKSRFQLSSMAGAHFFSWPTSQNSKQLVIFLSQSVLVLGNPTIGGVCFNLAGDLIIGNAKATHIVATFYNRRRTMLLLQVAVQVVWILNKMLDYGIHIIMNTKIYIDNESTICIVKNPVYHSKTKHIAIRHHFIRDAYEKKLIQVLKIHTNDNVADLLTKAFDVSRFQFLVVSIGMINP
ncbi:hypothetical protein Tco_1370120 [Tanacetum coccineum]